MPAASSARITSISACPRRIGTVTVSRSWSNVGALDGERARARRAAGTSSSADDDLDVDAVVADRGLQLVGRAVGDGAAVVEHDDVVGQPVGLLEVLRGEDDRGAVADELAQHLPQVAAAARVEPGGRLVEEQHLGRGDEAGGQVEPAAHAAREGLHQLVGRVGEVEPLEQLVGPAAGLGLGQVVQAADHLEVRLGRSAARRPWPAGRPRRCGARTAAGSRRRRRGRRRVAGPSVGCESVVRMRMAVVLPAPLWPSRPSTVPGAHVEVEVAQRPEVAEALAQPSGDDTAAGLVVQQCVVRMPYVLVRT